MFTFFSTESMEPGGAMLECMPDFCTYWIILCHNKKPGRALTLWNEANSEPKTTQDKEERLNYIVIMLCEICYILNTF